MARYSSQREKVKAYIERVIVPSIKIKDLDYYETVKYIAGFCGCGQELVKDVIKNLSAAGIIKELRTLTIPDEEISDFVKDLKKREEEIKKIDETLDKLEEEAVKDVENK